MECRELLYKEVACLYDVVFISQHFDWLLCINRNVIGWIIFKVVTSQSLKKKFDMYYETVKTPRKCSHNLWIIKVNKKPELTLPAVHCIYVVKFQLENLLSTYHIFSYFDFQSLFSLISIHSLQVFLFGFSSFPSFTDWGNPTILVYWKGSSA